jgi:hypothetical protein
MSQARTCLTVLAMIRPRPRGDVPPPAGLMPLSAYRLANDYLNFVTNEKQLVALPQRFEKYTGPVANAGG